MLTRTDSYKNEMPERSGKLILVQRLSTIHRIKFIYYGENVTIRMGGISSEFYTHLITYYGRCIYHSRNMSEYVIVPDRTIYNISIWRLRGESTHVFVTFPNGVQQPINTSIENIYKYRIQDSEWQGYNDWLYKEFQVTRAGYETTYN